VKQLSAQHATALPLRELSALAVRPDGSGAQLLAVGDEDFAVITAELDTQGRAGMTRRENLPTGGVDVSDGSGFEGIAADGARVFILQEELSRLLVFDAGLSRLEQTIELVVARETPDFGDTWHEDKNKRGEGLLLLKDGHVLVGRQRDVFLIEFGPQGAAPLGVSADTVLPAGSDFTLGAAELVPLAWWRIEALASVNDLAFADGRLYAVSSKDRTVARLPKRLVPGSEVEPDRVRKLGGALPPGEPDDLDPKPEGLVLVGGQPLVAFDTKFAGDNLLRFDAT
jgi:hypothetical protein